MSLIILLYFYPKCNLQKWKQKQKLDFNQNFLIILNNNNKTISVRERDESSYAICLSHEGRVKHYRIDILPSGNFAIQDGPKFESIIAVSCLSFFNLILLARIES